jgi:molybdopterin-containing oxidoreductase family iron-sulfur binding subunit
MTMDNTTGRSELDLDAIRRRLADSRGPTYWRSLEELAGTPEFQELIRDEFPRNASEWLDPVGRREFLKLMGASLALAGLTSCTSQPGDKIVPYTRAPEEIVPGKPLFFATAVSLGGIATGLLVESHTGRPTKVEGNPQHPGSLGATDVFAQASVLSLYDPDRSQVVTQTGNISTWNAFLAALETQLESSKLPQGGGLRILTETVTSPTLAWQLKRLVAKYPQAKWVQYEPAARNAALAGSLLAFGEIVTTIYRVDKAEVILSLGADFLTAGPGCVRYAREFASRRRVHTGNTEMSRLYAVESTPSLTGAMADHRLSLRQSEMDSFAWALAKRLGVEGEAPAWTPPPDQAKWIEAVAQDLTRRRGTGLIVPGDEQSPVVHALAHAMNRALGNVGQTQMYTDAIEANPVDQAASLRDLVSDMQAGRVETLLVLGGNPAYTAPADFNFVGAMEKVPFRVHLSLYDDETSTHCHWHLPEAHYLEAWGDARAYDGTVSVQQPLIASLYGGRSVHELLSALLGDPGKSSYDIVRDFWKSQRPVGDFDRFWRAALHDGVIPETALPAKTPSWKPTFAGAKREAAPGKGSLEIVFRPDPAVWDGRFANNGWLQELPKPLTKLTWDNAALLSPGTAERHNLRNEDVVELALNGRSVLAPVWILPGQPDDTVTVHVGYGRTKAGRAGTGAGFNAYLLRTSTAPWSATGLQIKKTGNRYRLASTQQHQTMEGRNIVREGTLEEYRKHPEFAHEMGETPAKDLTLYPGFSYDGNAWGMAIDLSACTGCNACVSACQAENNTPVVGKDQVLLGREMQWIRVDRYYTGELDHPGTVHQPLPCMHCENAPCEPVCPVGATVHSSEGLNDMVYNRCVGTRYCSNNCPYKVRRFNFLQYADDKTPSLQLLHNPNVTVRSRGVMEKCTYCVQRINAARIQAKTEDREVRDGDVVTACQAACPSQAIVFGNVNDPKSRVAQLKASPLNYGLLADLNTRPRTSYLARLRNPNPELEKA